MSCKPCRCSQREKDQMTPFPESASTRGFVQHLNPDDLLKNRAFTQVISVTGPAERSMLAVRMRWMRRAILLAKGISKPRPNRFC